MAIGINIFGLCWSILFFLMSIGGVFKCEAGKQVRVSFFSSLYVALACVRACVRARAVAAPYLPQLAVCRWPLPRPSALFAGCWTRRWRQSRRCARVRFLADFRFCLCRVCLGYALCAPHRSCRDTTRRLQFAKFKLCDESISRRFDLAATDVRWRRVGLSALDLPVDF